MDDVNKVIERLDSIIGAYRTVGSPHPGVVSILDDVEVLIQVIREKDSFIDRLENYIDDLKMHIDWVEDQLYCRATVEHY
jgi:hypothetical protein